MDSLAQNPKSLNPSASPYMRSVATKVSPSLPPNREIIMFGSTPQLPHEIYGSHPQQHPQSVSNVVPGFCCTPYFVQHHWVYQEAATAYYNIHRQPYTVPLSPPYCCYKISEEQGTREKPSDELKECETVNFDCDAYYSRVLSSKERRVNGAGVSRFVVPSRLRKRNSYGGSSVGKVWKPKNECKLNENEKTSGNYHNEQPDGAEERTSLMIKNIPNKLGRHEMLRMLDKHCSEENQLDLERSDHFKSEYDFFYLPMDFQKRANLGYAFVNFTNAAGVARFWKAFDKYNWKVPANRKICEISWAKIQGKHALCDHFKNSVFTCHTNTYLPVVLSPASDGRRRPSLSVVGRLGGSINRR